MKKIAALRTFLNRPVGTAIHRALISMPVALGYRWDVLIAPRLTVDKPTSASTVAWDWETCDELIPLHPSFHCIRRHRRRAHPHPNRSHRPLRGDHSN